MRTSSVVMEAARGLNMNLTKKDREFLSLSLKPLEMDSVVTVDTSDARRLGKLIAKIGERDNVLIANDVKKRITVVVDLGMSVKLEDIYKPFKPNRIKLPKSI